jgi:hypothetical protein
MIWHDEKFLLLEDDVRLLFFYLLTSPHSNAIGLYVLSPQYASGDLKWSQRKFEKHLNTLVKKGRVLYDKTVNLLCIPNHLKHNPLENENQAKAAAKAVASLPKSSLYSAILEQLRKPFHEPLRKQLKEQYSEPETKEETREEPETEEEPPEEEKTIYGDFKNVFFTEEEYQKLLDKFGESDTKSKIENLSTYIEQVGKKYKSHYATLLAWDKKDQKDKGVGKKTEGGVEAPKGKYDGVARKFEQ